jgi:hypothetical protein
MVTTNKPFACSAVGWIADTTILVQTGDIVDRGNDTIVVYSLFMRLAEQGRAVGGQIIQPLGNHEIMKMMGDLRYVTDGDWTSFDDE